MQMQTFLCLPPASPLAMHMHRPKLVDSIARLIRSHCFPSPNAVGQGENGMLARCSPDPWRWGWRTSSWQRMVESDPVGSSNDSKPSSKQQIIKRTQIVDCIQTGRSGSNNCHEGIQVTWRVHAPRMRGHPSTPLWMSRIPPVRFARMAAIDGS